MAFCIELTTGKRQRPGQTYMSLCQSRLTIEQLAKMDLGVTRPTGSQFEAAQTQQAIGTIRLCFKQQPVVHACTVEVSAPRGRQRRLKNLIGWLDHPVFRSPAPACR